MGERVKRGSNEGFIEFLDERVPDIDSIDGDDLISLDKDQSPCPFF